LTGGVKNFLQQVTVDKGNWAQSAWLQSSVGGNTVLQKNTKYQAILVKPDNQGAILHLTYKLPKNWNPPSGVAGRLAQNGKSSASGGATHRYGPAPTMATGSVG
jgi:hypothetical protein